MFICIYACNETEANNSSSWTSDNLHTTCLESHLEKFPPHTAPAGYVCPICPTAVSPVAYPSQIQFTSEGTQK